MLSGSPSISISCASACWQHKGHKIRKAIKKVAASATGFIHAPFEPVYT